MYLDEHEYGQVRRQHQKPEDAVVDGVVLGENALVHSEFQFYFKSILKGQQLFATTVMRKRVGSHRTAIELAHSAWQ